MNPTIQRLISSAAAANASGNLQEAERLTREALAIDSDCIQAWGLVGMIEVNTGRPEAAATSFEQVLRLDPVSVDGRMMLSRAYLMLQRPGDAAQQAQHATQLQPREPWPFIQLGTCQMHCGQGEEAIGSLRRAVELAPKLPAAREALAAAHAHVARGLVQRSKGDEALEHATKATELDPASAIYFASLASTQQSMGKIEEAGASFEQAIALDPEQAFAYSSLAYNRKLTEADEPLILTMERLERKFADFPQNLVHLEYGLGKARQDLGQFEQAMRHFDEANRLAHALRFGDKKFDRRGHEASVDLIVNTFTASFLRRFASFGIDSNLPILVFGMMRSGTTLVEQILSSHSQVGPGGERMFWLDHRNEVGLSSDSVDGVALKFMADAYVQELGAIAPGMAHVVDKMPINYSLLGLIHLALPNAKIIHIKRHPVDTCLSIYTTPNRSKLEWANDKGDIAFVYRQYERMMRHWATVLPSGSILDVRYEDLVGDQEATTRRMLDFCGLGFEEACLYPELNDRSVLTPSVWQVRQPVYTSSIERWRGYEPWLGAFSELL